MWPSCASVRCEVIHLLPAPPQRGGIQRPQLFDAVVSQDGRRRRVDVDEAAVQAALPRAGAAVHEMRAEPVAVLQHGTAEPSKRWKAWRRLRSSVSGVSPGLLEHVDGARRQRLQRQPGIPARGHEDEGLAGDGGTVPCESARGRGCRSRPSPRSRCWDPPASRRRNGPCRRRRHRCPGMVARRPHPSLRRIARRRDWCR